MMNLRSSVLALLIGFAVVAGACSDSPSANPPPTPDGGPACTDTSNDAKNCGTCGNVCPAGAHCAQGVCACGGGLTMCTGKGGASCVDTRSSTASCGACGNACAGDESCVGGLCVCPTDSVFCGGTCTDPRSNAQHCGATQGCGEGDAGLAGVVCPNDRYCGEGACQRCETFAPARTQTASGRVPVSSVPSSIATADLNHDGKVDLVAAGSAMDILLGHGDGTFEAVQRLPPPYGVRYGRGYPPRGSTLAFADFDGDGATDVVAQVYVWGMFDLVIFFGYGDGTFNPTPLLLGTVIGSGPHIGDFNGDGKADIALACDVGVNYGTGLSDMEVRLANGDGTFGPPTDYPAGSSGRDITTGDVNHDGKIDIISDHDGSIAIFLGKGDGTFADGTHVVTLPDTRFVLAAQLAPKGAGLDSPLDLVTSTFSLSSNGPPLVNVRLGAGDGTFFPSQLYPGGDAGIAIADVNNDGRPDILAGDALHRDVIVYLGTKQQPGCP